ncbi:MAG: flavodoxin family protein, partial [Candidatus Thorarchaeota archaeon]
MKVLVTYRSGTGNTEKIAKAIFEEINVEKEFGPFNDVKTLDGYDFIFVGC